MDVIRQIIDSIRQASAPRTSSYDTPADVVRVEGSTAWVHIPGGVAETPVQLTIDAKQGDKVQVRVGGGQAWLVGNLSAPPTDDTAAKTVRAELEEAKDAIFRAIDAVSILTRRLTVQDAEGNVLASFDADQRLAELAGWQAEHGLLHTTVQDPDVPTIKRHISLDALRGEIVVEKLDATTGTIEGDITISKDEISFGVYSGGTLWYRNRLHMAADAQRGTLLFDSGAPYGGQIGVGNYDHNNNTLYTGMSDISGLGDGTITGAINSLRSDTGHVNGSTVSLNPNTNTSVCSIRLRKGLYVLKGTCRFAESSARFNLHFSTSDGGVEGNRYNSVSQLGSGIMQTTRIISINTDGMYIYLVAWHNDSNAVSATHPGIEFLGLNGGGIYVEG